MFIKKERIRNFCIIAHIDHGKSTLADRILEYTNTIQPKDMCDQILDDMSLEREKGITIKSHAIQIEYKYKNDDYIFNLIDTPGHVDFSYEVSRSIAACEGAILVIDATQGIQAQTISNLYMAIDQGLKIIPVLNKIDLPSANIELVKEEIITFLQCNSEDIILASAKTGFGINKILDSIVEQIPYPNYDINAPLQAIIFDSVFNQYKGVEVYFKILNGEIHKGDKVKFINTNKEYEVNE